MINHELVIESKKESVEELEILTLDIQVSYLRVSTYACISLAIYKPRKEANRSTVSLTRRDQSYWYRFEL